MTMMDQSPPQSPGSLEVEALSVEELSQRAQLYKGLSEHLILCIDHSKEMSTRWNGQTRLGMLQHYLGGFIHYKLLFHPQHKLALCALGADTRLLMPFSRNEEEIVKTVNSLEVMEEDTGAFDFGQFFTVIQSLAGPSVTVAKDPHSVTHLTRVVLIYGRSSLMPELQDINALTHLNKSDTFFMDTLYLYKRGDEGDGDSSCQEIFDLITSFLLAPHRRELCLSQCAGVQRLLFNLQLLMAHPLQRDHQDQFIHKVDYLHD